MGTSLILGFFDGVHLGHKAVIGSALSFSQNNEIILLTFKESPAKYFDKTTKYIQSRDSAINKIKSLGVDKVICENFDEVCNINAEDYLKLITQKYCPDSISTGFNYTFGYKKSGNASMLEKFQGKYGYKYLCEKPYILDGEIVSSTLIKKYLQSGNIRKANKFLGSAFSIEGTVIQGNKIGRELGFPTANIEYPQEITEIPYGVYAIKTLERTGIMNYGIKPTVNNSYKPVIEVHILNFDEDLYGKNLKIDIIEKIRPEQKFNSLDELKNQIQRDKEVCLKLLS